MFRKSHGLGKIPRSQSAAGHRPPRARRLLMEPLENREMLSINLVSGVSDPLLLGLAATGSSTSASFAASSDGRYVAFESPAPNLVAGDSNGCRDVFVRDLTSGVTVRASTASGGAQANGGSSEPSLSGDGRYVVFTSAATNLVAGDTNGHDDVFLKDLTSGVTTRLSTDSGGYEANGDSSQPVISNDGHFVAFTSAAGNLTVADVNNDDDVFVKDLTTGATTRASTDSAVVQADNDSGSPAISADGRYVAFSSQATNLAAGDTNGREDVFVKDRSTQITIRASTTSGGAQGDGDCGHPALSGDGRYVVFSSAATNLVSGDTNAAQDIFLKDLRGGLTTRVSTTSAGLQAGGASGAPVISRDGVIVAFRSDAADLIANDGNLKGDVFVKNVLTGVTTRMSTTAGGAEADDESVRPSLSGDGRYVIFASDATNLAAGDINGSRDVLRKDRQSGALTLVSARDTSAVGPFTGTDASDSPAVSGDGRYVVFASDAPDLVSGDTNHDRDVFLKDFTTGLTTRVSTDSGGSQANNDSDAPAVTPDGRYVVFQSLATDLVSGDASLYLDVFLKDLQTGIVRLVSADASGAAANGDSTDPSLSADGRYVAFSSAATNLITGDNNLRRDVFVKDMTSGDVTRVSTSGAGLQADQDSDSAAIAADGRYVAFRSAATNLVTGDSNARLDIFVKDLNGGATTRVSTSTAGAQADDDSVHPSITSDGRYVAFSSAADNLIAGDTNALQDVFLKDVLGGAITRLSTTAAGVQVTGDSRSPAITPDGRYVAFRSGAADLVSGDANARDDVFVKDRNGGAIWRVSVPDAGGEANGDSTSPAFSADGRYVAFASDAGNFLAGDGNETTDVFRAASPFANGSPTGIALDDSAVAENQPAATVVGNLSSTDPDAGDTFTYSLPGGAQNDNGSFAIDDSHLTTRGPLDYESRSTYTVRVRTTDQGGLWFEKDFSISVTDLNEAPYDIPVAGPISVPENSPAGTLVCTLATSDPDAGDSHTYTMVDDAGGRFRIQGSQLAVADGWLLDYETDASHVIRVRTTDQGGFWFEKDFTVAVADLHDFASPAVFDPLTSIFQLRCSNTSGPADYDFGFGAPNRGWKSLVGDWEGHGASGVGLYAPESSMFYLTGAYQSGAAEYTFGYGVADAGWIPLVGDWDGDGRAGVGLYDPATSCFYLTNGLATGFAEYTFGYGQAGAGWIPLVGDWNGDGRAGVGLYDPHTSIFYLTNSLVAGFAEKTFGYGAPEAGWQPLVGDWNGDRAAGVGLFDPHESLFYLTSALTNGFAEYTFGYGVPDGQWRPLVGDFDGNRTAGVGLYDPASSTFYLTNSLLGGFADYSVQFGTPGGLEPMVGCWTTAQAPPKTAAAESAPRTALDPAAVDQLDLAELAAGQLRPQLDIG